MAQRNNKTSLYHYLMKNTDLEDVINFMTVAINQRMQKVEEDAVSEEIKEHK